MILIPKPLKYLNIAIILSSLSSLSCEKNQVDITKSKLPIKID